MRKLMFSLALLVLIPFGSATAHANGMRVAGVMHGMDLGQGEGGGGPLYEDGTAAGNFAISVLNGGLIFTVGLETWFYSDADHIIACGPLTVVRNDPGFALPSYTCTTPVPISGFAVYSDFDGDGRNDYKEWVRLVN